MSISLKNGFLREQKESVIVGLGWLLGTWKTIGGPDFEYQHWKQQSPIEYSEIAYSFPAPDTLITQKMNVVKKDGEWEVALKYPYHPTPLIYKVTALEENTFTFENYKVGGSYPQKIVYKRNGNILKVSIEEEYISTGLQFEKISE